MLIEVLGLVLIWGSIIIYIFSSAKAEPVIPEGTPPELMTFNLAKLADLSDGLIIYNDSSPILVRIICNNITAFGKCWYGENASIQIAGRSTEIEGLPKYTDRTWGSTITGRVGEKVAPDLTALLPVTNDDNHQWINITAKMIVFYPVFLGTEFGTGSKTVTGKVNLLVVSPEDIELKNEILRVRMNNKGYGIQGVGFIFSFIWIILLAPLISWLYNVYRRRRQAQPYSLF